MGIGLKIRRTPQAKFLSVNIVLLFIVVGNFIPS